MKNFKPERSQLLDKLGNPLTQSLFLEPGYSDYAIYTFKEDDYEYKGRVYPSIKKLYLEMEDPIEIMFAKKYFLSWQHWKRIYRNKALAPYIDDMREELELVLRSRAVKDIMDLCAKEGGSYQAAKFLADRGWHKGSTGRPSKEEMEKRAAIQERVDAEFAGDIKRLSDYRK